MKLRHSIALAACIVSALAAGTAASQQAGPEAAAELAKKLQNPIAALISVPIKLNWDTGIGPADVDRSTLIVQPVIPITLNDNWNVISRTITPVYIDAQSPMTGESGTTGNGDILQSLFFSPKAPTASGWIWGVGPVLSLPTASEDLLGSEKYSAGPTFVVLKQQSGWTYGMLANHLWSVEGDDERSDVNATFIQPFVSHTLKSFTTFGVNTESTYDWEGEQWTVPINVYFSQLTRFGRQPVSFTFTYRNYVEAPAGGPDWGLSFTVTLLYPK
ncbi:MAG: transporter [Burkholderiales bacterium]